MVNEPQGSQDGSGGAVPMPGVGVLDLVRDKSGRFVVRERLTVAQEAPVVRHQLAGQRQEGQSSPQPLGWREVAAPLTSPTRTAP